MTLPQASRTSCRFATPSPGATPAARQSRLRGVLRMPSGNPARRRMTEYSVERRHPPFREGAERSLRRRARGQQGELRRAARRGFHADRAERCGQDDGVQPHQPHLHPHHRRDRVARRGRKADRVTQQAPHAIAALGIARTFQNIELFEHATVLHNLLIGRHTPADGLLERGLLHAGHAARRDRGAREGGAGDRPAGPAAPSRLDGRGAALWGSQGGGAGACVVHGAEAAAARRAFFRTQRGGDGGHGLLDPGHPA
ncbi:hypothetical protein DdX_21549 [Ditylenchus destructor]|uniref:Uncharacterized protein n=1 Tax=Ditylenchus destructor TaxID=166010 RepID=A0AAD4QVL7_9BILA|nr:hypothetical protein DdX_21549 [Ditylenchus destructor]